MSSDVTEPDGQPEHGPVVIVLAAGEGSRMNSARSKLLHCVGGHSLLRHVLDAVETAHPAQLVVVVGHQREQVCSHVSEVAPSALVAVQEHLDGTAGAVKAGLGLLAETDENTTVVVACADMALLDSVTLQTMMQEHRHSGDDVTVLSAGVEAVFDANPEAREAWGAPAGENEPGLWMFELGTLRNGLGLASAEASLTQLTSQAKDHGAHVGTFVADDPWQACGVDDRMQLAVLGAEYNRRQVNRWMRAGVTIVDPATTWIETDVDLAPDVTLLPGTMLLGATSVARGATIGPEATLKDSEVGEGAVIARSTVELSVVGDGANVGPYARLRPGTQIGADGIVGPFVETKNATLGAGARLGRLTYCADATLGDHADVGASVVFAKWDSGARARTTIGQDAVVGAGATLMSPAQVADNAVVDPGATVEPAVDLPPDGTMVTLWPQREPRRSAEESPETADAAKRGMKEDR